jgi:hypothetical protein
MITHVLNERDLGATSLRLAPCLISSTKGFTNQRFGTVAHVISCIGDEKRTEVNYQHSMIIVHYFTHKNSFS